MAPGKDTLMADVKATQLVFTTPPDSSVSGQPLGQQPMVEAQNVREVRDIDFTDTVRVTETAPGDLTGHTSVKAESGRAALSKEEE